MTDEHEQHGVGHIVAIPILVATGGALLVLTVITVWVAGFDFGVANVWDPKQNIAGGTAYLGWLIKEFDGDLRNVLAAYNAGEGAVTRHGGMPPYAETRQYVDRVLAYYRSRGGISSTGSR